MQTDFLAVHQANARMLADLPYYETVRIDDGGLDNLLAGKHAPGNGDWLHGVAVGCVACALKGTSKQSTWNCVTNCMCALGNL